jgi:hypothetical protein
MISETRTFTLGPYTVRQQVRPDNPFWSQFLIFRGDKLVGKSFSCPDLQCCMWLERQELDRITYASKSAKLKEHTIRGIDKARIFSRTARKKSVALEVETEAEVT